MRDSGAAEALDFTDAGMSATFGFDHADVMDGALLLLGELSLRRCRVAVVEIADGLYQRETAALVASPEFRALLSGTFFAARDAMGAVAGVAALQARDHRVLGVSGTFTQSPLAVREVRSALATPVLSVADMQTPETMLPILGCRNLGITLARGV